MTSDELKERLGIEDDGEYRIHPESGVVQRSTWFGWRDTDIRIDPETGEIQEEGWLRWRDTDVRVDPETGVVQEEGWLGRRDTDTRIHPKTGIIQERGWFGWRDTDERIDPETGEHQVPRVVRVEKRLSTNTRILLSDSESRLPVLDRYAEVSKVRRPYPIRAWAGHRFLRVGADQKHQPRLSQHRLAADTEDARGIRLYPPAVPAI